MYSNQTILLYVSDIDKHISLIDLLELNGFIVKQANTFKEIIDNRNVCLVICEQEVNNVSGFDLLRLARSTYSQSSLPFLLIVNISEGKDMLMKALDQGFDSILFYPLCTSTALSKIKHISSRWIDCQRVKGVTFQSFFQNAPVPLIISNSGRIDSFNSVSKKILNISEEDKLIELSVTDLFKIKENEEHYLSYVRFLNRSVNSLNIKGLKSDFNQSLHDVLFIRESDNSEFYLIAFNVSNYRKLNVLNKYSEVLLTKKEKEIYKLSSQGIPLKLIAEKLNLSIRTVERHRSNIMKKANASNMIEAIANIENFQVVA